MSSVKFTFVVAHLKNLPRLPVVFVVFAHSVYHRPPYVLSDRLYVFGGRGRTRMDADGRGWTRTDADGRGRTRTDADVQIQLRVTCEQVKLSGEQVKF